MSMDDPELTVLRLYKGEDPAIKKKGRIPAILKAIDWKRVVINS